MGCAIHGAFAPTTSPFSPSLGLLIPAELGVPWGARVCSSGDSRVYWFAITGIAAPFAIHDFADFPEKEKTPEAKYFRDMHSINLEESRLTISSRSSSDFADETLQILCHVRGYMAYVSVRQQSQELVPSFDENS